MGIPAIAWFASLASALVLAPAPSEEGTAGAGGDEADASDVGAAEDDDPEVEDPSTRTIVVTGTRTERRLSDSPVATQVYDRQEIEDTGGENLAEVLDKTPGVQVSRGIGGVGIRLQGLDPNYTVILVDGQRTTGRINGVLDLSRFPAEQIEQIEIVRGPSSILYGADALAGAINLISRRPRRLHEEEAHFAYGSFGTIDATTRAGLSLRRYRGSVGAGFHRTDGWDADPSDLTTTGPESTQYNFFTTHNYDAKGPWSLAGSGSYLRRDGRLIDAQATGAVFDRYNRTEAVQASFTPRIEGRRSRLTLNTSYSLFRDQFLQDQRGSTELDQSQETYDHLGQVTLQYDQEIRRHVVSTGFDTQLEQLRTQRIDPPDVDRQRYAIFAQDEWTPTLAPKIVVLSGIRLDYDTYFGLYPTPRISTMVVPNERWTLRASYGRGYRAPSFREMFLLFSNPSVGYMVQGNPGLRAETSWSTSISAEYRPWSWAWMSVNVFDNRLQDTIVTDTIDTGDEGGLTLFQYVNIGEATTRGVEAQANVTILKRLSLDGSYTFLHSYDHASGNPLPGRAGHSGTAGLRYYRPASGTTMRVRSSIFGERTFTGGVDDDGETELTTSPAFVTMDLRVGQQVWQYVQLFAGVENILNAGNATDNPIQPRTYYGGLTIRH
ncbi:MAG: TonB-dependent receptor [Myxococcota bacterium]